MDDEFLEDPRAPVFFLSYARAKPANRRVAPPHEADRFVLKFFDDLNAIVNELVPMLPGHDPGFMDRTMEGGERWEKQVLEAAATCQVFVALLSTSFLVRSEWCAMEWDAFSRRKIIRRVERQPDHATGIIPLLWAPIERSIPKVVAEVERFNPTDLPDPVFAAQYQDNGILGLLRMSSLTSAYEAVIWRLGLQIQRMHHSHWVEPLDIDELGGTTKLRHTFTREAG